MSLVAGHDFDSLDRCKTCPRTWTQIMHVTKDQIGEKGIAHYDGDQGLTHNEYASIEARRTRERTTIWELVVSAATGNGPAANAAQRTRWQRRRQREQQRTEQERHLESNDP